MSRISLVLFFGFFFAIHFSHISIAQEVLIASDNFDQPKGLLSTAISWQSGSQTGHLDPFTDSEDMFGITDGRRLGSKFSQIAPLNLVNTAADISCDNYNADDPLGAVPCDYPNNYFGIVDTRNNQNAEDEATAIWNFDISNALEITEFCIDMAAMGDFESSDVINIRGVIDGQPSFDILSTNTMTSITQDYDMGGRVITLNDPVAANGIILTNRFSRICIPLTSRAGRQLSIILTAQTNGNEEAIAIDNIEIYGRPIPPPQGPAPNCIKELTVIPDDSGYVSILSSQLVTNIGDNENTVVGVDIYTPYMTLLTSDRITLNRDLNIYIPCEYRGSVLTMVSYTPEGYCETSVSVDHRKPINLKSTISGDTSVWCFNEYANADLSDPYDLRWYRSTYPYTWKPIIHSECENRPTILEEIPWDLGDYNGDHQLDETDTLAYARDFYRHWEKKYNLNVSQTKVTYSCGNDTLHTFYRKWALNSKGKVVLVVDTIHVFRLPYITPASVACMDVDTLELVSQTYSRDSLVCAYYCWKEFPALHSYEPMVVRYPVEWVDSLCSYIQGITDPQLIHYYDQHPIILSEDETRIYPCDFRRNYKLVDSHYLVEIRAGMKLLNEADQYKVIPDDVQQDTNVFVLDLCIPFCRIEQISEDSLRWEEPDCPYGISVMLPLYPGADECFSYCLTPEIIQNSGCSIHWDFSWDTISRSCPMEVLQKVSWKQLCKERKSACYSDGIMRSGIDSTSYDSYDWVCCTKYVYDDNIAPTVEPDTLLWGILAEHDCEATLILPPIRAQDLHSGVSHVSVRKAKRDTEVIDLQWDSTLSIWQMDQKESSHIYLQYPNDDKVIIEAWDSCGNHLEQELDITYLDTKPPIHFQNDVVHVSKSQAQVDWVLLSDLRIEVEDNCQLSFSLIRRSDWAEVGVDLCSSRLEELDDGQEIESFLKSDAIYRLLGDGIGSEEIELYYLAEIQSLSSSTEDCTSMVLESWKDAIRMEVIDRCGVRDEHGAPLVEVTDQYGFGGGWGHRIPMCCDDACTTFDVEILSMDMFCNYSISKVQLMVEALLAPVVLQHLEDIDISCRAVQNTQIGRLLDAAASFGSNINGGFAGLVFRALDEELGGYAIAEWEGTNFQDQFGNLLPEHILVQNTYCEDSFIVRNRASHDDIDIRDTLVRTIIHRRDDTIDLGYIDPICNAKITQTVVDMRQSCGLGFFERHWKIYEQCANNPDTLKLKQTINIVRDCGLRAGMFDITEDTTVCMHSRGWEELMSDIPGPRYTLRENSCISLGYDVSYDIFEDQNRDGFTLVRDYAILDWCSMERIDLGQNIHVLTCTDTIGMTSMIDGELPSIYEPRQITAAQVVPNPFSDQAELFFTLHEETPYTLQVFNPLNELKYQVTGYGNEGVQRIRLFKDDIGRESGMYFYRLHLDNDLITGKFFMF